MEATHSPQASPAKEAVRAPALRLSSSPCVKDRFSLFILLEQEGRHQSCENEGVWEWGGSANPPHSGWGRRLLPPHSGWSDPHCHFGTICSSVFCPVAWILAVGKGHTMCRSQSWMGLRPDCSALLALLSPSVRTLSALALTMGSTHFWIPSLAPQLTHAFLQWVFIECLLYARGPAVLTPSQAWLCHLQ